MLSVVTSPIMLSVVMLNVVSLSVVAPPQQPSVFNWQEYLALSNIFNIRSPPSQCKRRAYPYTVKIGSGFISTIYCQ
jgi:hypothetical protein